MSRLIDSMPSAGPTATPDMLSYYAAVQRPSFGEYLQASAQEGWWGSLAGQAKAWAKTRTLADDQPLTEEQWHASPDFRPEVEFRPGMSAGEAKARTDIFDENTYSRGLIGRRKPGFWGSVAGFGAGLFGAALSPESLIPFGEAMETAKAGLMTKMLMGARTGALQTAILAPPIALSQNQFGDDVHASDVLLNIGFGAVLGAGLGGLGHAASRALGRGEPLPRDVPLPDHLIIAEGADAIHTANEQIKLGESVDLSRHPVADTIDAMRVQANARAQAEEQLYEQAVANATREGARPSPSRLQRELGVDQVTAYRLVQRMESEGLVSAPDQRGERTVTVTPEQLAARRAARVVTAPEPGAAAEGPLRPLDRRSPPPLRAEPISAKEVEESVEAQNLDAHLTRLKDSGRLSDEAVADIEESKTLSDRARSFEPAARQAILCALGA